MTNMRNIAIVAARPAAAALETHLISIDLLVIIPDLRQRPALIIGGALFPYAYNLGLLETHLRLRIA